MSIEVKHIVKQFGLQKAVNDVSFSIEPEEIVGFLGPNGAGKSTTMKILTGYLLPDEGTVSICGIDVKTHAFAAKQKMGYLPEANPLYVSMYVKEYLDFIAGVRKLKSRKKHVLQAIELTGLGLEQNKKIVQLSKGYKQRVGLAGALIHHPEVLILDEPTSGLDPNQIIEIRKVIAGQGKNKTVLLSSHILQEVEAICNRIIVIHKGKIVADEKLRNKQQQYKQILKVFFENEIDRKRLQRLSFIENVSQVDSKTYIAYTFDVKQAEKQLREFAATQSVLVSLQHQPFDIEALFQSLTQQ